MDELIEKHYLRSCVRDTILRYCETSAGVRALNSDERWYCGGEDKSKVRIRGPSDYEDTASRGRTLYATLNLFHPGVFQQEEKWLDDRNAPETPIGTNANTLAFTLSVDIDGIGDIRNLDTKEAVECAGQFFVDFLAENGVKTSVYCLFSGGGIYVHLHHGLFAVLDYNDPAQTARQFTLLGKAFNLLITNVSREFFRQYGEHIGKVKFDKLNNQKRTFKTIFSIHKRLPYAVVPLDPRDIKIVFSRASLPLSDEVIEEGKAWYGTFDYNEKAALLELLKPLVSEVQENESTGDACTGGTISRKTEPIPRENFPPCIKNIIRTATDSEGRHRALGVLATYLYQAGWEEETAFDLWAEVADRCGVEARVFRTEWGRVCCPNCDTMKKNTGGYPNLNLHGMNMCCSDLGCLKAHWPGEYKPEAMCLEKRKAETESRPMKKTLNNRGNVERLIALHPTDLKFVREFKGWVAWNGEKWERSETAVTSALDDVVRGLYDEAFLCIDDPDARKSLAMFAAKCGNDAVYNATASLASRNTHYSCSVLEFDNDDNILNCRNGALNLTTFQLEPHDKKQMTLKSTGYDYDPNALCDRWLLFLQQVFKGDLQLIAYVRRVFGRALTGDMSDKAFFVLYGADGDNGKSKFIDALMYVGGDYAKATSISTFMQSTNERGVRDDLAALHGARIVTSTEPKEGSRFSMETIKPWTGGDLQTVRELFGKYFSYPPKGTIFIAANNQPAINERSDAAWDRLHVINFLVKFAKEDQDTKLHEKFMAERAGILNWALDGLKDYSAIGGLKPPESVKKSVMQYRKDNDTIRQFIDECCTIDKNDFITGPDMYASYKKYCTDSGYHPIGLIKFNKYMMESMVLKGVVRTTGKEGNLWKGITAPIDERRYG